MKWNDMGWRQILANGLSDPDATLQDFCDDPEMRSCQRLVQAWADHCAARIQLGKADFLSLVRGISREHSLKSKMPIPVHLPEAVCRQLQVSVQDFARFAMTSIEVAGGFSVVAKSWNPMWLPGVGASPDDIAHKKDMRRGDESVPADPILTKVFGFERYHSSAQQQAVRTVLTAPPGSTVVVNLPTGSGKTVCGFLPALIPLGEDPDQLGSTPIITPTVALALDLESRLPARAGFRLAYRPDEPEVAAMIRDHVAAGLQGPLLVSPESLIGSLRSSLELAATRGYMRYFVVDEAHMISAWGDEFRPAFQQIAGMRRELAELARKHGHPLPVTILMSATLTEIQLTTLKSLFGSPGPFRIVHAARLRPEPEFWVAKADTLQDRNDWVIDAVRHLPRPLIIYTLKQRSAEMWARKLRSQEFQRLALMHGGTPSVQRREILQSWSRDELDIVVATSAFGLGVDKSNVRAVLHVELPESIDRFYQEVGRGGRDGHACVSLLTWMKEDLRSAGRLSRPTYIGQDRGLQRWRAMFERKLIIDSKRLEFSVPINAPPSHEEGDMDMDNEENCRWNIRTLLLMARAKLIEIGPSAAICDDRDSEELSARINVRLLRAEHLQEECWSSEVNSLRDELLSSAEAGFKLLSRVLAGRECISHLLEECYASNEFEVPVVLACGGCAACRRSGSPPFAGKLRARTNPATPWPAGTIVGTELDSWLKGQLVGLILMPADVVSERLKKLLGWLMASGVRCFSTPHQVDLPIVRSITHQPVFLYNDIPEDVASRQATVFAVKNACDGWWRKVWSVLQSSKFPSIALIPEDAAIPGEPDRLIRDLWPGRMLTLSQWEEEFLL